MPDNGMDRGVGRPGNEALREALLRWENELGGQGPDLETVRRRLTAAPTLDARRWTARRSLTLAWALARAQLRVVPWLVVPLALLTASAAALLARLCAVGVGADVAVAGFSTLMLHGVTLTVTTALSRVREDAVCLATPLGPQAVVLARVAAVLALDAATGVVASAVVSVWAPVGPVVALLTGWLVPMTCVAGVVAFLAIWTAPWVGVVVGLVLAPIAGPVVSVVRLGALAEVLHHVLTLSGAPVLGLGLVLAVSLSARHALTARAPR